MVVELWYGDVEVVVKDLMVCFDDGWMVLLCVEGEGMVKCMFELLGEYNVVVRLVDDVDLDVIELCV